MFSEFREINSYFIGRRKSPAGFITLEVTAEVRINTKPKIDKIA